MNLCITTTGVYVKVHLASALLNCATSEHSSLFDLVAMSHRLLALCLVLSEPPKGAALVNKITLVVVFLHASNCHYVTSKPVKH